MERNCLLFTVICCLFARINAPSNPRKNILNVSKQSPDPEAFWPLAIAQHNTSTTAELPSTYYAVLHSVSIISNDPGGALLPVMSLQSSDGSKIDIPNNGSMDGNLAMCWIFYIYPRNNQASVLLSYKGTYSGGYQIRITDTNTIQVKLHDANGTPYTYDSAFTVSLQQWTLVGINYNHLWPIAETDNMDIFKISQSGSVTATGFKVDTNMISENAAGDVTLGSTFDGADPFNGDMYCVQFYKTSLIGGTQQDTPDLCDPSTWTTNYGHPTLDYEYYTLLTAPPQPFVDERSNKYRKTYMQSTIQSPIATIQTKRLMVCAAACQKTNQCFTFAFDSSGTCLLGTSTPTLVPSAHHNVYVEQWRRT